jgi:phosphoserine phosphatase
VQKLIAIAVFGEDKPGIIHAISGVLAENSVNIVDIEQTVIQGLFVMFIVGDVEKCDDIVGLKQKLNRKAEEIGLKIQISPFERRRLDEKNLYTLTVLGKDRIGIVHAITQILYKHGINIERTSLTARDNLISIEFLVDLRNSDPTVVKKRLKEEVENFGLDIVIRPFSEFKKEKRLIVFDMDSTIVDAEIIVELAKAAGVEDEVEELTKKAMNGEMSFEEALRERVKLLRGLPVQVLEKIYNEIRLTEGAKELIQNLKKSGYKVALVSGGFTYFTEKLKRELELDYAFGNELEMKNGKLTGRLKGKIIDSEEKARIIDELARIEGVSKENVVAVGDGANDKIMIENAGLGIAFNAKEALKEVADGTISKDNLIGLASILNLPNEFRKRV